MCQTVPRKCPSQEKIASGGHGKIFSRKIFPPFLIFSLRKSLIKSSPPEESGPEPNRKTPDLGKHIGCPAKVLWIIRKHLSGHNWEEVLILVAPFLTGDASSPQKLGLWGLRIDRSSWIMWMLAWSAP